MKESKMGYKNQVIQMSERDFIKKYQGTMGMSGLRTQKNV